MGWYMRRGGRNGPPAKPSSIEENVDNPEKQVKPKKKKEKKT